jgi:hypothetical protein
MMVSHIHNHDLNKYSLHVRALQYLHQTNNFIKVFFGVTGLCAVILITSPIIILAAIWATYIAKKIAKGLQSEVDTFSEILKSEDFSYHDVKKFMAIFKSISDHSVKLAYTQKDKLPKFLHSIVDNMRLSHISANKMIAILEESYTFKPSDTNFTENELEAYNQQFHSFKDAWGHEDTDEEKELNFIHKKHLRS